MNTCEKLCGEKSLRGFSFVFLFINKEKRARILVLALILNKTGNKSESKATTQN